MPLGRLRKGIRSAMPSSDFQVGSEGLGDGIYTILAGLSCAFLGVAIALVQVELLQFYKVILVYVKKG